MATGCRLEYSAGRITYDVNPNLALGKPGFLSINQSIVSISSTSLLEDEFAAIGRKRYGIETVTGEAGAFSGSTDFVCFIILDQSGVYLHTNSILHRILPGQCDARCVLVFYIETPVSHLIPTHGLALPGLHPAYGEYAAAFLVRRTQIRRSAIPTQPEGGNHTALFAQSAGTEKAHEESLILMKVLAITGSRVLTDKGFARKVWMPREERT